MVFSNSIKNKCITIQISQSVFCFQFHQPIRKHLHFIIIFVILSSLLIHSRSTNVNFISNIYNCAFATVFLSSLKIYCCCIYMHSLKFMEITDLLGGPNWIICLFHNWLSLEKAESKYVNLSSHLPTLLSKINLSLNSYIHIRIYSYIHIFLQNDHVFSVSFISPSLSHTHRYTHTQANSRPSQNYIAHCPWKDRWITYNHNYPYSLV